MKNKKLAKYIIELAKVDQGARSLRFEKPELVKGIPNYLVYAIDGVNNMRIRKIIEDYGYPTQKLIGKQAMGSFWILIQHQDFDLGLQEECLKNCDFQPKEEAPLTDRVLLNSGKKQIYGTQFHRDKKLNLVPRPIKDIKNLDKRRKSVGLEPFKEYRKKMEKIGRKTKNMVLKK
ncbi:MAG: hypothetical protein Q8N88_05210 [Nanoarchaeota archaeon]|nr:hypothetical protein [Nanoarchaeota archaeon]